MCNQLSKLMVVFLVLFCAEVMAKPVVSIVASGKTSVSVPQNTLAAIYYTVTNNSSRPLTLNLEPLTGITQSVAGAPIVCGQPIVLPPQGSCLLTLVANGNNLPRSPVTGLRLSRKTKASKVYSMPTPGQDIYVIRGSNTPELVVISGDPIILYEVLNTAPVTKVLTIQNASTNLIVNSIAVELTSWSQSNPNDVLIDASNCNRAGGLLPGQTCMINFTPAMLATPIKTTEKFDVIISANGSSKTQTTAHLTLNPPVPITYSSAQYSDNPQIVPFPSGSLQLTLTNISGEAQTLNFTLPSSWRGVSYTGCSNPLAANSSCILTLSSTQANYASLFTINATSSSGYTSKILVPVAFVDADNNLVYSVNASTYSAVNMNHAVLISTSNVGYQWCSTSLTNCNQITTGATNSYNGMVNSSQIIAAFTAQGAALNTYAAGYCATLPNGTLNLNYYLPAICELGDSLQGAGCNPNTDNIYSNLIQYGFLSNFNGPFWSATEITTGAAWLDFFYGPVIGYQYQYVTNFYASVACVTQGHL
ncbi:protein with a bacterial immunoglobulin-like domain [Legionella steigerwaltii]|uniref:Protein with a bacterial immunoglobulin-like domain n=2 Tax=Legionella steigerwaltii TaxID=460 RepID=A0A378L794_9GAMM|nr:hypothetical protein [Legionella steigerwaltii]KTD77462.1 protein with a bacterial immunoglobulin-like domain protein [Legionella steigerwaltii]STY22683.1 protein with a bacterial immunoglobulin-like domain [Legionella steigerwaltii]